jgi:hypothetical protein
MIAPTDFETRQLLGREYRDRLSRDMQAARRTRPERSSSPAALGVLGRAHDYIRFLTRTKREPSSIRPQEV